MKTIPLTQGKVALVDNEDYEWLMQWKWQAHNNEHRKSWYALRSVYLGGGRKNRINCLIWMHRLILGTPQGMETDHINGDGLDNRRCNLRVCTRSQNAANREKKRDKVGYKGVHWHKQTNKWRPRIKVNYKSISLGLFEDQEDAARAYDRAAMQHFGEFARTNF